MYVIWFEVYESVLTFELEIFGTRVWQRPNRTI